MSKSLKRVRAALAFHGMNDTIRETGQATTAQMAADELGCTIDQIVKSIIFRGLNDDRCILFLTAGGNQVDPDKATELVGQPLGKADANLIRAHTGFAIVRRHLLLQYPNELGQIRTFPNESNENRCLRAPPETFHHAASVFQICLKGGLRPST